MIFYYPSKFMDVALFQKNQLKTPIFGKIAKGLQIIFIDRENPNSWKEVLEQIIERQKKFMEGKPVMSFIIFPEGSTNSGRHFLKFKKGSFINLLPVKPNIIHPNLNSNFHLRCGATDVGTNYETTLSELYFLSEFNELPIMKPNIYMKTNFTSYGKENWEIYTEVDREIICELGGFKKSEKHLRDKLRINLVLKKNSYWKLKL